MRITLDTKKNLQAGFTLIEMTIVMLVLGVLIGSGLHAYKIYQTQTKLDATERSRMLATLAIDDFKRRYGRYPCPARYDLKEGDAEYGRQTNCADTSVSPGNCTNGICVELSERTINVSPGVNLTPRVRRGMLPFKDLALDEKNAYDDYNARFSYAVTENLTDSTKFDIRHGGISIVDGKNNPVVEPAGSALFFLFSHGPDNIGAYGYSGTLMAACNGPMYDNQNCNTSTTDSKAIYRYAMASDEAITTITGSATLPPGTPPPPTPDNTHFDDEVGYAGITDEPLWKFSEAAGQKGNMHDTLAAGEKLAIGPANLDAKLNVAGNSKVTGNLKATTLCTQGNADCFEPQLIGGTGMTDCVGQGKVAVGIKEKKILCDIPANISSQCDNSQGGKYVVGIDANGKVICGNVVQCTPYNTGLQTRNCVDGGGITQWNGFVGTYQAAEVKECPSGNVILRNSTFGTACTCRRIDFPHVKTCGNGESFSYSYTDTWFCVNAHQGEWRTIIDESTRQACPTQTCTNTTNNRTLSNGCNQTQVVDCNTNVAGPWTNVNDPANIVRCNRTNSCKWFADSLGTSYSGQIRGSDPQVGGSCNCGASGPCFTKGTLNLQHNQCTCK